MSLRYLKRDNFRHNWPLWLAVGTVIFSVVGLVGSRVVNQWIPQYPDYNMSMVIYPLLVFSSWILLIVPLALFVSLFVLLVWAIGKRYRLLMFIAALAANALACYICIGVAFNAYNFSHKQDFWFSGHHYRLAAVTEPDWDYPTTQFVIYECDAIGLLCTPLYLSDGYYSDDLNNNDNVLPAELRADSPTNMLYLQMGDNTLYVRDIDTGHVPSPITLPSLNTITAANANQLLQLVNLLRGRTSQLAWSPDGNSLAVGGSFSYSAESDQIGVWLYNINHLQDPPRLLPIPKHEHNHNSAESVAFNADGKLLAVGSGDYTVRLLDIDNGHEIAVFGGLGDTVDVVVFSPDGKELAVGSWYHEVWLWDISSLSLQAHLRDDENAFSGLDSVAFSPNGDLLVSAGSVLHLWDIATTQIVTTISLPGDYPSVNSVAFSPDGKWLAYGGWQNLLKLWDVEKHIEHLSFELPDQYVGINSLAFNPDGTLLVTGSSDKLIRIWDVQTREQLAALNGYTNQVRSVAFSPDGKLIASTGDDGTVRLWGVPSSTP